MDHPAQRPQRRRQRALHRLHDRQPQLAQPGRVPSPGRGDALGRECQARARDELLRGLAAAIGDGPAGPRARDVCAGRHRRRQGAGAGYMAQRSDSRRCREAGARALPRPLESGRSQGSHGEAACRRRQGLRDARGETAGGRRSRHRPVASRARQQGRRQRQEAARLRAGGSPPGSQLSPRPRVPLAPRREDRRSRAGDAVGSHRSRTGPRRRGLVGRATDNGAQAAGYRGCSLGLSRRGGSRGADQGKLPGRAPFHGRLDRAAVPR